MEKLILYKKKLKINKISIFNLCLLFQKKYKSFESFYQKQKKESQNFKENLSSLEY